MISLNLLFISLALGKVQAHSNHCSLQARFDDLGPEPRALETYGDIYDEVLSHRDLLPRAGPRPPGSPGVNPEAGPTTDETSEDKDEEYIRNGYQGDTSKEYLAELEKEMEEAEKELESTPEGHSAPQEVPGQTGSKHKRRSSGASMSDLYQTLHRRAPTLPRVREIAKFFRAQKTPRLFLFWSKVDQSTAYRFARSNNLVMLGELTNNSPWKEMAEPNGRPWSAVAQLWDLLSGAMAIVASMRKSEVFVMIDKSKMLDKTSVWNRVERPHLQKRNIHINWFDENGKTIPNPKWPTKESSRPQTPTNKRPGSELSGPATPPRKASRPNTPKRSLQDTVVDENLLFRRMLLTYMDTMDPFVSRKDLDSPPFERDLDDDFLAERGYEDGEFWE